jgi:hypothetical protein
LALALLRFLASLLLAALALRQALLFAVVLLAACVLLLRHAQPQALQQRQPGPALRQDLPQSALKFLHQLLALLDLLPQRQRPRLFVTQAVRQVPAQQPALPEKLLQPQLEQPFLTLQSRQPLPHLLRLLG